MRSKLETGQQVKLELSGAKEFGAFFETQMKVWGDVVRENFVRNFTAPQNRLIQLRPQCCKSCYRHPCFAFFDEAQAFAHDCLRARFRWPGHSGGL